MYGVVGFKFGGGGGNRTRVRKSSLQGSTCLVRPNFNRAALGLTQYSEAIPLIFHISGQGTHQCYLV